MRSSSPATGCERNYFTSRLREGGRAFGSSRATKNRCANPWLDRRCGNRPPSWRAKRERFSCAVRIAESRRRGIWLCGGVRVKPNRCRPRSATKTSPDKSNPEWSDIVNAVSVDRQRNWKAIEPERQTGLEIILLKRTYVFPWSQFLYAEGGDDEIRAVFTTHDLIVRGKALTGLLAELAGQRIARLQEPARTDRFEESSGPVVRQLIVERVHEARS